jgi:hypothetical protein
MKSELECESEEKNQGSCCRSRFYLKGDRNHSASVKKKTRVRVAAIALTLTLVFVLEAGVPFYFILF